MENDVKKCIAEKLFDFFVINPHVVGVQMPDGNYIPKKIPFGAGLIYNMLQKEGSLGTYQQQYYRNVVKWICLDFDLKKMNSSDSKKIREDKTFHVMIEEIICPFILYLREKHITCLTEFSGRRGIHVWILIEGIVSKSTAFILIDKLAKQVYAQIIENECFGLDLFPATNKGNNKYGKLVKIPLSVHRKGGQSFFIRDICSESIDDWLNYPDKNDFWEIQNQILEKYTS